MDINLFKWHSSRTAPTSAATQAAQPISEIHKVAGWKSNCIHLQNFITNQISQLQACNTILPIWCYFSVNNIKHLHYSLLRGCIYLSKLHVCMLWSLTGSLSAAGNEVEFKIKRRDWPGCWSLIVILLNHPKCKGSRALRSKEFDFLKLQLPGKSHSILKCKKKIRQDVV